MQIHQPTHMDPSMYNLLMRSVPQNEDSANIALKKEEGLLQLLVCMNPGDDYHFRRIKKTDNIFKKYEECIDWLKDVYATKGLEELFSFSVDPSIQFEHDYVIQLIVQQHLLKEEKFSLCHKQRDSFSLKGDRYEKIDPVHLQMINKSILNSALPVTLKFINVGMNDADLEVLIPAIKAGKIEALYLQHNNISGRSFIHLAEALHDPKCQLKELNFHHNPITNEAAFCFIPALKNTAYPVSIILTETAISQDSLQILEDSLNAGHPDSFFIA